MAALSELRHRPHHYLLQLAIRHGPVVCLNFWREPVVLVSGPEAIQYILHHNHANYQKLTSRWQVFREILGDGLLTSNGTFWRRQRQRIQPAFHQERLQHFELMLASEIEGTFERWEGAAAGAPIDLYREMLHLALNALAKTMFGRDVHAVADAAIAAFATAHVFINPMSLINLLNIPTALRRVLAPGYTGFRRAFRVLDEIVVRIIAERRASGGDSGDLLSMLVLGRDEDAGERMSERQVRDEVMTAFMAGHETTAICLTWSSYLLSRHPATRRDLQAEVDRALCGRLPTMQDLPNLPLTKMVIEESLRLYPPAWGFDRRAMRDDVVGGFRIPAGATVAMSPYVTQRHPAYWKNPEGFDPLRFRPEQVEARPLYAYFPFGGGPRRCIGHRFAMVQMQLTLAAIVQRFELDLVPGPPVEPKAVLNFAPQRPVRMTLHPRGPVTRH